MEFHNYIGDFLVRVEDRSVANTECKCFTFRSKRAGLERRLNNLIVGTLDEKQAKKALFETVAKLLSEAQIETLIDAVKNKDCENSECILLPESDRLWADLQTSPQNVFCLLWRWPQLEAEYGNNTMLRKLPFCISKSASSLCCNPYHWSRLKYPGSNGRQTTSSPSDIESTWCKVAYWEHDQRVGRLMPVCTSVLGVFAECLHGNGVCLSAMQQPTADQSLTRARVKIGAGIIISRCGDDVWLYNRAECPVFVSSPTVQQANSDMCPPSAGSQFVDKVLSGYSLKVYDMDVARTQKQTPRGCGADIWSKSPHSCAAPHTVHDLRSVQISFGKGWGTNYKRQSVIACPCWLELIVLC